jgi:hypothetical protein
MVRLTPTKDNLFPKEYQLSGVGDYDYNKASPVRYCWWSWAVAVARALQNLGVGIPAEVGPNFGTMDALITTIQEMPGLPPLICGGKPPLLHRATHPEMTSPSGRPINWQSSVSRWLTDNADGSDITAPAVRMTGGAKALQETLPPDHSTTPTWVHVVGDSTLRVGAQNMALREPFKAALKALDERVELGAYRLYADGDLLDLTSIVLGILDGELAFARGEDRAYLWHKDHDRSDWLVSGSSTLVDGNVCLKDLPDGSINSAIQI